MLFFLLLFIFVKSYYYEVDNDSFIDICTSILMVSINVEATIFFFFFGFYSRLKEEAAAKVIIGEL